MQTFMLTTKFPGSLLENVDLLKKQQGVRAAYLAAAPSFHILSSYKVNHDTTIDIVEASSAAEVGKAAHAITKLTETKIDIAAITPYHQHLHALSHK